MQNYILNGLNVEPLFKITGEEFLKYNSQEAIKRAFTADKSIRPYLKKLLINKAIWTIRAERMILTEEYIKSQCKPECDGTVYCKDDYGAFLKRCPIINNSSCLISMENKKAYEDMFKLKEVFKPYEIPNKYFESEIDKVKQNVRGKIYRYLQNLHENINTGKGIFISGNVGTGKTSILYLIIRESLEYTNSYYCTINDVFKYLIRQNEDYIAKLYYADILLIDDLGREYLSDNIDFGIRQFDEVIDYRYREGKATCLTTNFMFETVKDKYPRVYDRMKEKNQFLIITGESQRLNNWRE